LKNRIHHLGFNGVVFFATVFLFNLFCVTILKGFLSGREAWSEKEKSEVRAFFAETWGTTPNKEDVMLFKERYGNARDWHKIKDYVRYMMRSKPM